VLVQTKGVFLRSYKMSNSSNVGHFLTLSHGIVPLILRMGNKGKKRLENRFFPLEIVDLSFRKKEQQNIANPQEINRLIGQYNLRMDVIKMNIAQFFAELVFRAFKNQNETQEVFGFIEEKIVEIEVSDNFTRADVFSFVIQLTNYLGCYPNVSNGAYFDLMEGSCTNHIPSHPYYLSKEETELLRYGIINSDFSTMSKAQYDHLMSQMLVFYKLHVSEFGDLKSYEVLKEVFA